MPDLQMYASMALFAATMTGTPGPNNMMLTASGANHGYLRSLPHLLGISIGVASLITSVAAGLGMVFHLLPGLQQMLKLLASAYLVYLAWRIGTALPPQRDVAVGDGEQRPPMSFVQALLFQYVNPKAWAMAITAIGTFTMAGEGYWWSALAVVGVFLLVGFPLTSFWALFGVLLGRVIRSADSWIWFNRMMGILTASCLLFIW